MNSILEAASELQTFCSAAGWKLCFIGGLAVQRWGEPRQTQDADLTLITGFGTEELFVDQLLTTFQGRREDTKSFALRSPLPSPPTPRRQRCAARHRVGSHAVRRKLGRPQIALAIAREQSIADMYRRRSHCLQGLRGTGPRLARY